MNPGELHYVMPETNGAVRSVWAREDGDGLTELLGELRSDDVILILRAAIKCEYCVLTRFGVGYLHEYAVGMIAA